MPSLTFVAVDPEGLRREWSLAQTTYVVGREPAPEHQALIAVPGDRHLSREHFQIQVQPERVVVERLESGRNPLYYDGEQHDLFTLRPGQVFYSGKTQFGLVLGREPSATTHYTLVHKAKEEARLRRLEDCFDAVLSLLGALRAQSGTPAWQVAFPVLRTILPEVEQVAFLQLHGDSGVYRLVDSDPHSAELSVDAETLAQALASGSTLTVVCEEVEPTAGGDLTLTPRYPWMVLTPISGLEEAQFLLCASGSGSLGREALVERATLVDLVCEMIGHHIVIQQGSEYSNLLGVFGHHVGTLFKNSGALKLWSDLSTDPEVKQVLGHLLPIWGISQAISLHKKRGEKAQREILRSWVKDAQVDPESLSLSLRSLVAQVYHSSPEAPYFHWTLNGQEVPEFEQLLTLPPLDDVPLIYDKTLALTVGLVEILSNVRKYPTVRGSGREDRRDLSRLPQSESVVRAEIKVTPEWAAVELTQPVVTAPDGTIPRSRSLERIRALEQSLLGGLVGTRPEILVGPAAAPNVVLVKHTWIYNYGQLVQDWRAHFGS